jgi:hypothetical protein
MSRDITPPVAAMPALETPSTNPKRVAIPLEEGPNLHFPVHS